ncbi:beta-galactosidase [Sphingobacterium sp. DN00404]|uniref:beta-galactosidase n=1 Tax=Sphingobacterium micropteri TaxID=2763501 RepID=A0ABR7YPL3_9SPHI|nr:sugar-binding domain-containing protein [Sphingobacterium micropteri]MBD1433108.1 beta-galactosidase [Sphingobacterium micropteri]
MHKKTIYILISLIILVMSGCRGKHEAWTNRVDLSGEWGFREDAGDVGVQERWFEATDEEVIKLPGSMASNGKGEAIRVGTSWTGSIFDSSYFDKPEYAAYRQEGNIKVPFWLQPNTHYVGAAWYFKEIEIPQSWDGRHIELILERPHWETSVWLNGKFMGMQNSLSTAHRFQLDTALSAGKHRLAVRVDNRIKEVNPGQNAHSLTDHTQTNWNGIVGQIYLATFPTIRIDELRLFPDTRSKRVRAELTVSNRSDSAQDLSFCLQASTLSKEAGDIDQLVWSQRVDTGTTTVEKIYNMGADALLWNEFKPNLYRMSANINGEHIEDHTVTSDFGLREVGINGTNITINGEKVFLRGALESAVFPLSGYPATDTASWTNIFKVLCAYGLNHLRFHSWCPPEAAFAAADRAGVYLQIECAAWPNWGTSVGDGAAIDRYLYEEAERIIRDYGNHPSFIMMTHGNEPGGKNRNNYLDDFVSHWKKKDPRRIYTAGAGWPVVPENDYENIPDPRIQQWEEGLASVINAKPPQTQFDWSDILLKHTKPVVSHEIGQWCVYPDFKEMEKYKGVLKPKNFEIFADRLKNSNLYHLADSFLSASGKLQALCYKADIEAALRTPGMAGFQLLGLQDFPGQGTALVGVVNPFWEDKGYINAAEYSQFCNRVVPLARFAKMNMLNTEMLEVPVEVANFSGQKLEAAKLNWQISEAEGNTLYRGSLPTKDIEVGNGVSLGIIRQSLSEIDRAKKLVFTLEVEGYKNSWDFFVYPKRLPDVAPDVIVTSSLTHDIISKLDAGAHVLLTLPKGRVAPSKGGSVAVGFSSIFWNTAWTNGQAPHTLGILCDPGHPALREFPADFHSNWQWWDAMSHSNAIFLDAVAKDLNPIVRIIDDWVTARSLGLIFEGSVGKGKLMVSGIDLSGRLDARPEARQLLYSLKRYMQSDSFHPSIEVPIQRIQQLLLHD